MNENARVVLILAGCSKACKTVTKKKKLKTGNFIVVGENKAENVTSVTKGHQEEYPALISTPLFPKV